MTATCNGLNLLACSIQEPRIGVWSAVIDVDTDDTLTGKVTLQIDGVSWVGTIIKGDHHAGRFHAQIAGGAGKLATVLDAKYYLNMSLQVVLGDLMLGTGETLASTTYDGIRSHTVARWARPQGKASAALRQVADEMVLAWRVLRDGTVWLGIEDWQDVLPKFDEIDKSPGRDSLLIAPEAPSVLPGATFLTRKVSRVTTTIQGQAGLRQEILFEGASGGSRVSEDIAAFVDQQVSNRIDYSRLYPCRVLKQSTDGTLELLPDSEKLRGNGLTRVPIRHGIPGLHVNVPAGGKVLLFFESGDPKLPACALWPDGSSVQSMSIKSPTVTIDGDLLVTGEVTAKSQTAPVTLSRHQHPTAVGPSGIPTPGT